MSLSVDRRPENLALVYQEVLTAVERLRANRQGVTDAGAFRHHTRAALKTAASQALAAGYNSDDTKYVTFAAVAFLDESVLHSQNPIFGDWLRKPLQEELFGTHIAGDVFFQNLQHLLTVSDSSDLADVLELHYLCLLLGFRGRYSGNPGELGTIMQMTADKIHRIRGRWDQLSPSWKLPPQQIQVRKDRWLRIMTIIAVVSAVVMILLFIGYKLGLSSGVSEVHAIAAQVRN